MFKMTSYISVLDIIARGGGGGSGGGGGGAGIIVIPLIIIGVVVTWWKRKQRIKRAEQLQHAAVQGDPSWHDDVIAKRVEEVFYKFEQDWSDMNFENMKQYLTPTYLSHMTLVLAAMQQMNRRNELTNIKLKKQTLFGVNDSPVDELDTFNIEISANLVDRLVDTATGKPMKTDGSSFTEIWHFEREGKDWALDNITQINRDGLVHNFDPVVDSKYSEFAKKNGCYYNADFGWLLLPFEGNLFSHSSWGKSDINHHVIGLYKNVIVQFFEYTPLLHDKARLRDQFSYFYRSESKLAKYTIAKATLPRDYSNIIVRRRHGVRLFSFTPRGMQKVSLESGDFNKSFDVFASDIDKVNSLELLHPAFISKLIDLPFHVSLEIIGSTLYLYTTDTKADYQTMLDLLQESFHEMKM